MNHTDDENDFEYLLALAEEISIQLEQQHAERMRERRKQRRRELCAQLRAEIHALMFARFSWQQPEAAQ
jgi:hypothetical protein